MSEAQTWVVRVKKSDWDAAEYGAPIQTVVAAATPEEARSLASTLLEKPPASLQAFRYTLGAGADDAATQ